MVKITFADFIIGRNFIFQYVPAEARCIGNCELVMSWDKEKLWWDYLLTNSSLDAHDSSPHNMLLFLFFQQKALAKMENYTSF